VTRAAILDQATARMGLAGSIANGTFGKPKLIHRLNPVFFCMFD
jgi:hypothetical protein